MSRLADHSDVTLWPVWVTVAAVALMLAAWWLVSQIHAAPMQDADTSPLDVRDGITEGQPPCHSTGPRGGHYVKAWGPWWVCGACGETWPRNADPYDREAEGVVDEAEQIAREASA